MMKKPFIPQNLPIKNLPYGDIFTITIEANRKISEYNTFLQTIPNPEILLSTLTIKESVLSSRIEGTQATLEEVVEYQDKLQENNSKFKDIQEVINYRNTLNHSVNRIKSFPLSLPLIKELHQILLSWVRWENKDRGNFRKIQNWIGSPWCPMEEATYIPPNPHTMNIALDNLEKYFYFEDIDILIQAAIIHAQFEIIHPFLDGNGRIGRLLIPLFLYSRKLLDFPSFYMSEYFNNNKDHYYKALNSVSEHGDRIGWINYFLEAVVWQASINILRIKKIINLFQKSKENIQINTRTHQFSNIVEFIFTKPIFTANEFIKNTWITKVSAYRYLKILEKQNIIESDKERRNKKYYFTSLLDIIG